jgi:hypothetical protein
MESSPDTLLEGNVHTYWKDRLRATMNHRSEPQFVPDTANETEKSVLAMFYEGVDIPAYISERMFLCQKNRIVFSTLKHLKADGKKPDLLMLNAYLISHKLNEQVGVDYLAEISGMIGPYPLW